MRGEPAQAARAARALSGLYDKATGELSIDDIQLGLSEMMRGNAPAPGGAGPQLLTRRSDLHGRTVNQVQYLQNILAHDITFGIGPAGTGKTYLAVACAVDALERDSVKRLVLVRPAVEAGERLGFLPGDLAQKVDPYLRPLYDALYDLMGFDKTGKLLERGTIELAPLAYMRGRTLNHAFIILDEAQNTTPEQMKMFLTRIGFGAKAVVTGDVTQIDLARGQKSGLIEARRILSDVRGIAIYRVRRQRRGAPSAGGAHHRCLREAFRTIPDEVVSQCSAPYAARPLPYSCAPGRARPVPARSRSPCGSSVRRRHADSIAPTVRATTRPTFSAFPTAQGRCAATSSSATR